MNVFSRIPGEPWPHLRPGLPARNRSLSRQTCRAALRAIQFHHVSTRMPLETRRNRRRLARLFACLEYRRMMADPTNAIPDEAEQIYRRLSQEELAA